MILHLQSYVSQIAGDPWRGMSIIKGSVRNRVKRLPETKTITFCPATTTWNKSGVTKSNFDWLGWKPHWIVGDVCDLLVECRSSILSLLTTAIEKTSVEGRHSFVVIRQKISFSTQGSSLIPRPLPDFISQPWRKVRRSPGIKTMSRIGNGGLG